MFVSEIFDMVKNIFGDTSGAQITDEMMMPWINSGQKDICRKTECLEGIALDSTVSGTDEYNYPVDFLKEQVLKVNGIKLSRLTRASIDQLYPDRDVETYRGNPLYYYHYNRQFVLYPIPGTTGTNNISIWYVRYAVDITATTQIPQIPEVFHEDLVRYCLWHAYENDEDRVTAREAKQEYEERLLQTAYDSQVEQADSYPAVRCLPGDY